MSELRSECCKAKILRFEEVGVAWNECSECRAPLKPTEVEEKAKEEKK